MTAASRQRFPWLALCLLFCSICSVRAQSLPPWSAAAPNLQKLSKFDTLASRTGTLFKCEHYPIASAVAENVRASIVRLEDLLSHDVAFSLQIELAGPERTAVVSEEEMADLKGTADYIAQNASDLSTNSHPIAIEYHTLNNCAIGYAVHRRTSRDEELPPTAYVLIPANPYIPQSGAFQRLSPQLLQRLTQDAAKLMDDLRAKQ